MNPRVLVMLAALLGSMILTASGTASGEISLTLNQVEGVSATPLLKEVYSSLGITLNIVVQPAARGLVSANSGAIDGEVNRIAKVSETYKNLIKVDTPVFYVRIVTVTNESLKIESWNDLKKYRAGTLNGLKIVEKNLDPLMKYRKLASFETLLKMLKMKRIDVAVAPLLDVSSYLRQERFRDLKLHAEKPLAQIKLYHFLNARHKALVPRVEKVLRRYSKEGKIESYYKKVASGI